MRTRNYFKALACGLLVLTITLLYSYYKTENSITIKILGINDFHGQISKGKKVNQKEAGSGPVLAAYIKHAQIGYEDNSLITLMGDQISASPLASGLLNDEPAILFLSSLANTACQATDRMNPKCNMVATIGNHEFDKGQAALLERIYGSNKPPIHNWINLSRYPGASYPHVSANILNKKTKQPVFPPYVIKEVAGVKIAFIGAILKNAPEVMIPSAAENLVFLDEATAINHYAVEAKSKGANVVVVIIHQGGKQESYEGATKNNTIAVGKIIGIIKKLDNNVDLVMSGHTHDFLNAYVMNEQGKKILVTQANSYSTSFAEVTLIIDKRTKALLNESARIVTTYADVSPTDAENLTANQIAELAEAKVAPMVQKQIGELKTDLIKKERAEGESDLGNLIADAMRYEAHSDIAFMNPGGLRNSLYAGKITYGQLYAMQPFNNFVLKLSLTGQDIYDLLEQQWRTNDAIFLQVSGLSYTYDESKPIGSKVVKVLQDGKVLHRKQKYTVATNDFLFHGGDGFTVMKRGKIINEIDKDLNVSIRYIKALPQPFSASSNKERIRKL